MKDIVIISAVLAFISWFIIPAYPSVALFFMIGLPMIGIGVMIWIGITHDVTKK